MSRIGKKPIEIPQGVEVDIQDKTVKIKGLKGELQQPMPEGILVEKKRNSLVLRPEKKTKQSAALWGLARALLQNCIEGANKGFEKKLEVIGVGYKAALEGDKVLNLSVGFSEPVKMEIPEGLKVSVEKNIITVVGIDKQKVGQFSAEIRATRKPEPYKGKGIRYLGEKVRRKEGKKATATTS